MMGDAGKGGYDVFKAFAVDFIDLMFNLHEKEKITNDTFSKIKKDVFSLICRFYYTEKLRPRIHTYEINNIKDSVSKHYGILGYYKMFFRAFLFFPKSLVRIVSTKFAVF